MEEKWEVLLNNEISSLGRVRDSEGRMVEITTVKGNEMNRCWLKTGTIRKHFYVHNLVAMAFLGYNPEDGVYVVNHINGDRSDDRLCNLKLDLSANYCSKFGIERASDVVFESGMIHRDDLKPYIATVDWSGITVYLGCFDSEIEAVEAIGRFKRKKKL